MDGQYDPAAVEPTWREVWARLQIGHADAASDRPMFSMALPPPNITGALHLGHALNGTLQDTLARFQRMRGAEVCWVPGTDHAAIATNAIIERQLAAEGTSKEAIGREAFDARVARWYAEYQGVIFDQLRRLGVTCDWARERFTLDEAYVRVIRRVFRDLFDAGLIYRGPRIVNWCPVCRSAISDEEVEYREREDAFYYVRYPFADGQGAIEVATARPETIPADVAVGVPPDDPRYRDAVGRQVIEPITGRAIPVIADPLVDPAVGTGALKITPGHAPDDYTIGARHGLPVLTVLALDGTMATPDVPRLHGLPVPAAREVAATLLREAGALVRTEPLVHQVSHCDRSGTVIEPLVTPQWWVRTEALARPAAAAVRQGAITFHPRRYGDEYLAWLDQLQDWCISRQIWLGHRIPVSTCANQHVFAWIEEPVSCPTCQSGELTSDADVLDTWFSSALWPFAILGWPEQTAELRRFYPTSVVGTSRDILRLWVARMVMMGLRFAGAVPFRSVLIHATVLRPDGQRMSKSRGTVVDPLEMIDRYGADATRAWAASIAMSAQDARFDERRIEAYRRFANKLWNMTRLLDARLPHDDAGRIAEVPDALPPARELADRWILDRLAATVETVTEALAGFDLTLAVDTLYDFAWHELADWYWELIKGRLATGDAAALATARRTLLTTLLLLHPVMPFVTDACASRFAGVPETLDLAAWPAAAADWWDPAAREAMAHCLEVTRAVRGTEREAGWRHRAGGPRPRLRLAAGPAAVREAPGHQYIAEMAGVEWVDGPGGDAPDPEGRLRIVVGPTELALWLPDADRGRDPAVLDRELTRVAAYVAALEAKLAGPFAARAPADVIARERAKLDEARRRATALQETLGA
ncbi:MAG TPA: valine--tRNA ligase [Candidatus Dormibacteraeota bacterium]|nr:valine--tRNA ligase [Candidatus Dormibacteraeota bacterium]